MVFEPSRIYNAMFELIQIYYTPSLIVLQALHQNFSQNMHHFLVPDIFYIELLKKGIKMGNCNMPNCNMPRYDMNRSMPNDMAHYMRDHEGSCMCDDYPIGMGYVPWQEFKNLYEAEKGFHAGTIFMELEKPFIGRRMYRR